MHVSCKLNLSILLKKDIPIKSSGTSASGVAFQAYLIEGLARWNLQRSQDSIEGADEKVPRSFDISLKHRLNALSCAVHNKPALSSFCTPPAYTGEIIGMSYLRSQTGDCAGEVQELDNKSTRRLGISTWPMMLKKIYWRLTTVAMPEDSSDSGNEVIIPISIYWVINSSQLTCYYFIFNLKQEDEEAAVDALGIPGWDKVGKLASALLALNGHVTNKRAAEITQLYLNLDEYDRKALVFPPKFKRAKGRFLKKKTSGHIGTAAMARYNIINP